MPEFIVANPYKKFRRFLNIAKVILSLVLLVLEIIKRILGL